MPRTDVNIATRDGTCPASVFTPANMPGPWPAVLFFMDGPGIRPALWDMGQRLADAGYLVLMPDLFYRDGPNAPKDAAKTLTDPQQREAMIQQVRAYTRERKISDAGAFLDYLDTRDDVKGKRVGVTGYCMGGHTALTAAGAYPDRFAAIASFHGGNLAADNPDSPHHFVGKITGRVLVAGADQDASFPEEQKVRLDQALSAAGVLHTVEIYPGALHGYAIADTPVYNRDASERHWTELLALLGDTLPAD